MNEDTHRTSELLRLRELLAELQVSCRAYLATEDDRELLDVYETELDLKAIQTGLDLVATFQPLFAA